MRRTRVALTCDFHAPRRAAACMKLGRHADALADAQAAVGADGGYAKGYLRRALAHQALGGLEDAVRDLEKARAPTLTLSWMLCAIWRRRAPPSPDRSRRPTDLLEEVGSVAPAAHRGDLTLSLSFNPVARRRR